MISICRVLSSVPRLTKREGKERGVGRKRGKLGRKEKEKEKGSAIVCAPAGGRHTTLHSADREIRNLRLRLASRLSEPPREKQNSPP